MNTIKTDPDSKKNQASSMITGIKGYYGVSSPF